MTEIDHGDITTYVSFHVFNEGLPYDVAKHSAELVPLLGVHSPSEEHLTDEVVGEAEEGWDFEQVLDEFYYSLRKMGQSLNMSFPVYNRSFVLVDKKDVLVEGDHKQTIIDLYGEDIENTAAGSRVFLQNGGYELRIGYKGREDEIGKDELMEIMAHEYAHTLGSEIPNPILEECKALAFSYEFSDFRLGKSEGVKFHLYNVEAISEPDFLTKWEKRGVHDRADELLTALQMNGKSRAQVLADLTGARFGNRIPSEKL